MLPLEVLSLIASNLHIPDLHRLSATSHHVRDGIAHLLVRAPILDGTQLSSRSTCLWSASVGSQLAQLPRRLTICTMFPVFPKIAHFNLLVVFRLITCDFRDTDGFDFYNTILSLPALCVLSFLYTPLPPFPAKLLSRIPESPVEELDCIMPPWNRYAIYQIKVLEEPAAKHSFLELLRAPCLVMLRLSLCMLTVQFVNKHMLYANLSRIQTLELHGSDSAGMDVVEVITFCKQFMGVTRLQVVAPSYCAEKLSFCLPLLDTYHGTLHSGILTSGSSHLVHVLLIPTVPGALLIHGLMNLPVLEFFEANITEWDVEALELPERFFPQIRDFRLRYYSRTPMQSDIAAFFTHRAPHLPYLTNLHLLALSSRINSFDSIIDDRFYLFEPLLARYSLSEVRLQRHAVWRNLEGWRLVLESIETSLGLLDDLS